MSTLIKKLKALSGGQELPWPQIVALVEAYGARVIPPRGGGSHFKIIFADLPTIIIPVHNGKIKRVYAAKIAEVLESMSD